MAGDPGIARTWWSSGQRGSPPQAAVLSRCTAQERSWAREYEDWKKLLERRAGPPRPSRNDGSGGGYAAQLERTG
jgi:hypothetical protein